MAASFLRWGKVLPLTNTAFRGVGGGGRSLGVSGERTTNRGAIGVPHQNTVRDQASSSSSVESLPGEADVVVVGGGVAGCSVLYHLAKLGLTNTILLEAHQLTAGTTWHTAGLFFRLSSNEVDCMLQDSTMRICLSLEEETGVNPSWINNGSLFLTSRKEDQPRERQQSFEQMMSLGKVFGVESHLLNPAQIKDLHPLLNVNDLQSAVYTPTDGSMDPAGICLALTRAARWAGARVVEGCRVTDITTAETTLGGRKVTEVHTTRGVIKTNVVVNATGGWSNDITNMVGLQVPLQIYRHGYLVTDSIPGFKVVPNVRNYSGSSYLKPQGEGFTVGVFEVNPVPIDKLSPDFSFGLYEPNWDIFGDMMQTAAIIMPALETVGVKSTIYGPESFTPDGKAIVGDDPNIEGFFHCCGFNSGGMQLSGGCGEQIAKWVVEGRPEIPMFNYDIRRFHPLLCSNRAWILARTHEKLLNHYNIVFPHDEPLAGRRQRCSPLHQVLEDAGAVYQEKQGWERPGWFGTSPAPVQEYDWYGAYGNPICRDLRYYNSLKGGYTFGFPKYHDLIQRECLAAREGAAVFDMSSFGKYYLTGRDAQKVADWVFSADVTRALGTTVYTCMLNHRGGIEADLTVSVCEGGEGTACDPAFQGRGFYLTTGGSTGMYNISHILKEARTHQWDIQLLEHTEDLAILSVQGPKSRCILQALTDEDLSNEAFPYTTHKVITLAGHKLRALRISFVGEMGWELHVPSASALAVYKAVMAAGEPLGVANAGFLALDSLSCEKGYRHWNHEIRPDDTPLEAGLTFTCKLNSSTKFLGREAVEAQIKKGFSKKLVTFTLDDPSLPLWGHEGIWRDDELVGHIRRAEYAFTLGRAVCYGYVERLDGRQVTTEYLKTGTWQLEAMLKRHDVTVHLRPPFDPKNLRVKGVYKVPQ